MATNNLGVAQGSIRVDTSDLKNADIALRSAGDSMINFGVQAVGAFAAIVGEAAKFEKEMDFVKAVTDSSAEDMRRLEQTALDLAKNSVFGPIELSKAFVELAKAGATAEQIVNGVGEASVQLATAADVEIPFAGENLINILNTFQLGAEDAVHVANLLAGAANASSVDLSDMVTTMRYAGPVAAAMGVPIEDLNTALSVLGRVGIKGSTAGTSLRFMMTRLIPDTDKAKEAIRELGLNIDESTGSIVEFTNTDGSLKGLADIMQILQDRTKGLTDQQKIAVVNDIFGVRAMPSVLALMEAGEAGFAELEEAINRTTVADVAAQRMDNLDGSIKRLKATLSAMFVDAGGPFQQMLKDWVDGLREFLLFIDALPKPLKTFLVGAIGVIGVMSLFAGAFLLTIGNIVRMVRVMGEIRNAFTLFSGAARAASAANTALGASFLLNPWVLLVVAIIAVIAALIILYKKWDAFREFVDNIAGKVVDAWHAVADWFEGPFVDAITGAFDWIENFFEGLSLNPLDNFKKLWNTFWDAGFGGEGITTELENIFGIFERLGVKFEGFVQPILDFFGSIGSSLGKAPELFKALAKQGIEELEQLVVKGINFFLANIEKVPGKVGYAIGFVIGRFIKMNIDIVKNFVKTFKQVGVELALFAIRVKNWAIDLGARLITTILDFLLKIPGFFERMTIEALTWLWSSIPQFTGSAWDIGYGILKNIKDFLLQIPGEVYNALIRALTELISVGLRLWDEAKAIGRNIFDGLMDFILDLPDTIRGILNKCIDVFKSMVTKAFNAARDFSKGLWDGFKDGLGINSPSLIEQQLSMIDSSADSTYRNLMRSIRGMNGSVSGLNGLMPSTIAAPAAASPGNSMTWQQNAPLIGEAVIRDDRDIELLARKLEKRQADRLAAAGRRQVVGR